jgi:lysophospholipid acyltransferase (LPLAT)-like uncharacterized protein
VTAGQDWQQSRLKRAQIAAIASVGYPLVAAVARTWSWRVDGVERLSEATSGGLQPIFAFWHGRILPATYYFRHRGIVVMTSRNFDGEWIARIITKFGYGTSRGSTTRGGLKALLQMKRDMAEGRSAAFTVDGPRGPARVVQPGAVWLAKATGNPVVPFHIEAKSSWMLKNWDRTAIPKPFTTVALAIGSLVRVAPDADAAAIEEHRVKIENCLVALEARAGQLLQEVQS